LFENVVLRKIFQLKEAEWRRLHNKELHNLYSSLIIIRVIKSRRMNEVMRICSMHSTDNKCIQYLGWKT